MAEAAVKKSVVKAETASVAEAVPVYEAAEISDMLIKTPSSSPTHAPVAGTDGHRSSIGAILRLMFVIGLGLVAVIFLVEAVSDGSAAGGVIMGLALAAVVAAVPFLWIDWRLTRER